VRLFIGMSVCALYSPEARTSINPAYPPFAQPSEARHAIREIYCRRLKNPNNQQPAKKQVCVRLFIGMSVRAL
jgi:hypothetical protein